MLEIKELSLAELEAHLKAWGQPAFRARQIFSWIYKRQSADFAAMSDLPEDLRKRLKENFHLWSLNLVKVLKSQDATEKFIFQLKDKNLIEAASIPVQDRMTVCISTQVGCKFACGFCASGLSGFKRNLTCAEMIDEVLSVKNYLRDKKITNLVFMGTGEPLDNYDHLLKAIRMTNSPAAFNIGARKMTISSCGIIPGIKRLAGEGLQIELSISLHAADDKTRSLIMPINKKYPLKQLISACRDYIRKTNRQITFEYILIQGINSDLQSVKNLCTILRGLDCKINLIPANPVKELKITPPQKAGLLFFKDTLLKSGIKVTLRKPRGEDIQAACGQLRLRYA